MPDLAPFLARPIAHRGLHDAECGIIENTGAALLAAIEAGYAVEADLQEARCGTPVVFHDETLERLTERQGRVRDLSAAELAAVALKGTADHIPTLSNFLALCAGRAALLLEIKTVAGNAERFARRIAADLSAYRGSVAVISFDPKAVAPFRELAPHLPRGIVAMPYAGERDWRGSTRWQRFAASNLLHCRIASPHLIAYRVNGLERLAVRLARGVFKRPVLAWTVRSQAEAADIAGLADNIIFEGFRPHWPPRTGRHRRV
jgi:glycerophosphoryl diester phosphodiesterase